MKVNITAAMAAVAGLALIALTIKLAHNGAAMAALLSGIFGVGLFGLGVGNISNDNIR